MIKLFQHFIATLLKHYDHLGVCALTLIMAACTNQKTYTPPKVDIPTSYKEGADSWKIATPQEGVDRGDWWEIFDDEDLNDMMHQLNASNQSIAVALAQYQQSQAIVTQTRAGYWPQLTVSGSGVKEKVTRSSAASPNKPINLFSASLNATWEPDFWGSISQSVDASVASAEAAKAQMAVVTLSMQASLAQYYFQLRTLDLLQKVLDNNVQSYKKLLKLTEFQFKSGIVSYLNIVTIKSQLDAAEVQAMDNGIARAQYEHAIAVLLGKPASVFSIASANKSLSPPTIPAQIPSTLLERRPDIAQAERQMASANFSYGAAASAYFPAFSLTGSGGYASTTFSNWFTAPASIWSFGPQVLGTLFDGGALRAKEDEAKALLDQDIASYKQTVLAAFQDVEDNLVSLRILNDEIKKQNEAVANAKLQLKLVTDEYASGTIALADVITAQINLYTTQNTLNSIIGRRMVASVGLIKALGGGWNKADLQKN